VETSRHKNCLVSTATTQDFNISITTKLRTTLNEMHYFGQWLIQPCTTVQVWSILVNCPRWWTEVQLTAFRTETIILLLISDLDLQSPARHGHAKGHGQRSVGSKDKAKTNRQIKAIPLPPMLMR